jgi:hypothetical protein
MCLTLVEVIKSTISIVILLMCSLLIPTLHKHQLNCAYPISLILMPSLINFHANIQQRNDSNSDFLSIQFLLIIGSLPYVFIFTISNIIIGALDGILLKLMLDFSFGNSLIIACLIQISLQVYKFFKLTLNCELLSYNLSLKTFKYGLIYSTEMAISHIIGISLIYHYL